MTDTNEAAAKASEIPKPNTEDAKGIGANGGKVRSEVIYPYFGLRTALALVQAIRSVGGSEAPSAEIMKAMGVEKVTDRRWSYGVPAATHFGLVARVGRGDDGRVKLTPLANRIALPSSPEEARAAKIAAFTKPELYSKLLERYAGHPIPAKEGLRNLLHREFGIVESMATNAAEAFIESLKEAELLTSNNIVLSATGAAPKLDADPPQDGPTDFQKPGTQTVSVPADFIIYKCKISGGRIIEIPLPPEFGKADVRRLNAFLLTQIDDQEDEEQS